LGYFFKDLSGNVRYTEQNKIGREDKAILHGTHPLRMIYDGMPLPGEVNPVKAAEILQAIRKYRPNQKIRSLIGLHPPGYHASHLIDPNYMWVGLGK